MRNVPKILTIATMLMLLLTMAQGLWHFVPVKSLTGVSYDCEMPKLTMRTYVDGSWQAEMDRYARRSFGFREYSIRLYNQYVWSCYRHTTNKGVVPGRKGYIYERYFVEDYYESRMYKYTDDPAVLLEKFECEAARLGKLQSLLKEYGTTLFVAVLPGKDVLYPEYLPPRDTMTRTPGPRAYPEYLRLFDKYGVNYIDVMGWFKNIRDEVPYELMTKHGTHWSNIASTYAFDSIMRYMQSIGGAPIRPVQISEPYYDEVRKPDADLVELFNLVVAPRQPRCKYADVRIADTSQGRPKLIVIGDSFFWNVTYNYPIDSLFGYTHYWFYNNTVYFDPEHDNTSQIDIVQAVKDADYVMLSYCTGQLYDLGNEFIGKTLVAMMYSEEEIAAVREDICAEIRSDEKWYRQLQEKSEELGITVEQAMLDDANYLIQTHPEWYFVKVKECQHE